MHKRFNTRVSPSMYFLLALNFLSWKLSKFFIKGVSENPQEYKLKLLCKKKFNAVFKTPFMLVKVINFTYVAMGFQ